MPVKVTRYGAKTGGDDLSDAGSDAGNAAAAQPAAIPPAPSAPPDAAAKIDKLLALRDMVPGRPTALGGGAAGSAGVSAPSSQPAPSGIARLDMGFPADPAAAALPGPVAATPSTAVPAPAAPESPAPLAYVLEGSHAAARLAGVRASYQVTAGLLLARAEAGLPDIASETERLERALLLAVADKQVRTAGNDVYWWSMLP